MATAAASALRTQRRLTIGLSEVLNFAYDAFCSNKLQFTLTSLAMAVGTASVILVVTIGMTGKQYILRQIQSIGANMIYADYQGGLQRIDSTPDPMTVDDVKAIREQVPSVVAASPTRSMTASAWETVSSAIFSCSASILNIGAYAICSCCQDASSIQKILPDATKSASSPTSWPKDFSATHRPRSVKSSS
jgi:hypothetical protein